MMKIELPAGAPLYPVISPAPTSGRGCYTLLKNYKIFKTFHRYVVSRNQAVRAPNPKCGSLMVKARRLRRNILATSPDGKNRDWRFFHRL